jgi:hypothetical protein
MIILKATQINLGFFFIMVPMYMVLVHTRCNNKWPVKEYYGFSYLLLEKASTNLK